MSPLPDKIEIELYAGLSVQQAIEIGNTHNDTMKTKPVSFFDQAYQVSLLNHPLLLSDRKDFIDLE